MATATGWGALPISLSFGDSIKNLVAELNGPVAKAAKNAGGSIEKEIGNASKKAADQYEKQQWRMEKATKEKTAAEENHRLKLLEQQRAQTALENAEKDLADARESGGKKARDAQLRYEAAQIKVEKATIATRKASDTLDGSIDEIAKATESAEQAFKDMEKAQEDSNKESSKMGGMFEDMSGKAGKLGGALKDVVGKVGPLAAGIAGAASIGEVISLGQEAASSIGGLNRELGLTGDEARVMGDEVGEVLRSGVVGSAEEAAEAVGVIKAQFKDLSDEDISDIADNFAGFSQTFEIDMAEATQTAGQLMTNGLAGDAEEAADLMTAAMQRMPKAMRDELPELTNEYGTFFSSLGYSGEDMMGMFVNMSDQGKIAMDKLGDSLKEAGIRATDLGDSGAVEALEEIGLGADDIQNRLLAGGDTAKEAFQEMVGAIQSVEDPAERAEAAVALIGTPLEDLNKAEIDGFLDTLSGGADAMEGFEGSSQELSDSIANSLQGRMDALKGTVQDLAGDAFMYVWDVVQNKVIPAVKDVAGWFRENADTIKSLAAGIGTAVGAWTLFTGAMKLHGIAITIADKGWKAYIASTKIATAVTNLFNKATKANVIGLIATALIAVGGALVYFFTQTETGRELWEKFTSFLSDAWQKVSEKFAEGIDWISEKWNSFTSFMGELWGTIKTTVFDAWTNTVQGIRDGWGTFTGAISGGWTWLKDTLVNVWTMVRDAVFAVFIWYINRVKANFELVTGALSTAWTWLKDTLVLVWTNIRDAVFAVFIWYINWLKNTFEFVTGAINSAWTWLKDGLVNVWNTIRDTVVNAFINAWNNLRANFDNVMGLIGNAWQWLKGTLRAGWDWIDQNVLGAFRSGMDSFKSFFDGIVDGIGTVWNKLRGLLAKPINFMINTVYNGGILKAWETIRKFLPGLKEATPLAGIPEHATGGRISGPGTGTSDDVLMWGSNGEHMLTAKEVQRLGGHKHVYAMRQMVESGRPFSFDGQGDLTPLPRNPDNRAGDLYGAAPGLLPAYRDGGEIRPLWEHQLMAAHKFAQSQSGKPYQWAGPTGPGSSFDCSGFMGSIAATIQGDNPWQRYWATGSFPSPGAQGFAPGLGPGFSIGIFNGGPYGGHTAGTLGPAGSYGSVNVESGGAPSMVKYGTGAVGADHSQFTMQYHLPIGADGSFVSGGGGGISPEAMQDGLKKKVSDFVDKAMNPILSKLPVGPPEWKNIPKNVYDKGKKGMLDTAFDVVGKLGDKLSSVWSAAGEVKDLVTGAVGNAASWVNNTVRDIVVRDNGGIVPNGSAAVNLSGKDELMLPPSTTALFNKFLKDMPGVAGALERSAVAFQEAAAELGLQEEARKSAEDYAAEQASGLLSTFGLEGLVPLAQKAGGMAWDAYVNNPVDVAMTPNGVTAYARKQGVHAEVNRGGATVTIEAESDEDLIRVSQFKKLAEQVDGLEVQVKRKPKAAVRTRGGVM